MSGIADLLFQGFEVRADFGIGVQSAAGGKHCQSGSLKAAADTGTVGINSERRGEKNGSCKRNPGQIPVHLRTAMAVSLGNRSRLAFRSKGGDSLVRGR